MDSLTQYLPLGILLLFALVTTGLAAWKYAPKVPNTPNAPVTVDGDEDSEANIEDSWGLPLWLTPLAYLLLLWFFAGTDKLNVLPVAVGGAMVYTLEAFLLFLPALPKGLRWHYPVGAAALLFFFLG